MSARLPGRRRRLLTRREPAQRRDRAGAAPVGVRRDVSRLSAQNRLSDPQNWRTVELVLEGAEKMTTEGKEDAFREVNARPGRKASERDLDRFARRVKQGLANIEYFLREPLGWREGPAVVWAGVRGAVTVAAASQIALELRGGPET